MSALALSLAVDDPMVDHYSDDDQWRSCFFCGMHDGVAGGGTPHWNQCVWLIARRELGLSLDGHFAFVPLAPTMECDECGYTKWRDERAQWHFNGYEAHEEHEAAAAGLTVAEWRREILFRRRPLVDCLPAFMTPRGAIGYIRPPALDGLGL